MRPHRQAIRRLWKEDVHQPFLPYGIERSTIFTLVYVQTNYAGFLLHQLRDQIEEIFRPLQKFQNLIMHHQYRLHLHLFIDCLSKTNEK